MAKLSKQVEAEQYYDGTDEETSDETLNKVEVQELKDVLEDLLRQTNGVSTQEMSAEMQGFSNVVLEVLLKLPVKELVILPITLHLY